MTGAAQLPFLLRPGPSAHEMVSPTFRVSLSTLVKLIRKHITGVCLSPSWFEIPSSLRSILTVVLKKKSFHVIIVSRSIVLMPQNVQTLGIN